MLPKAMCRILDNVSESLYKSSWSYSKTVMCKPFSFSDFQRLFLSNLHVFVCWWKYRKYACCNIDTSTPLLIFSPLTALQLRSKNIRNELVHTLPSRVMRKPQRILTLTQKRNASVPRFPHWSASKTDSIRPLDDRRDHLRNRAVGRKGAPRSIKVGWRKDPWSLNSPLL